MVKIVIPIENTRETLQSIAASIAKIFGKVELYLLVSLLDKLVELSLNLPTLHKILRIYYRNIVFVNYHTLTR
ncbi:MAG: hypothetical protein AB4038_15580 [Prochloraceae cyanobacterium]